MTIKEKTTQALHECVTAYVAARMAHAEAVRRYFEARAVWDAEYQALLDSQVPGDAFAPDDDGGAA